MTRLAAVPAVAATVLAGIWVTGGLLTDDYRTAMALTAGWLALACAAAVAAGVRRRSLALPVTATALVTAGVAGGLLFHATAADRVVDEHVVAGVRASELRAAGRAGDAAPAGMPKRRPVAVELARGRFRSLAHDTAGTAAVVRLAAGGRVLTLTGFRTDAGPDLRVVVDGGRRRVDLGALRGNRGDQQYRLPAGAGRPGSEVLIWCRLFSVDFGAARLAPS